jgi:hypothetical protein
VSGFPGDRLHCCKVFVSRANRRMFHGSITACMRIMVRGEMYWRRDYMDGTRADFCLKQVCACGTIELARMHVRIRGHGRVGRMARSFLRALWPSFEGQDMLKWHIMHADLAASVMGMQRSGRRAVCCQELGLGLRASDVDRVQRDGKPRQLPRRLRSCSRWTTAAVTALMLDCKHLRKYIRAVSREGLVACTIT